MKAILHIGTEKTGTTSIQTTLSANRRSLLKKGFHYPQLTGVLNHSDLVAFAQNDDRLDDLRMVRKLQTKSALKAFRENLTLRLQQEVGQHSTNCHTFLFSSEHMSSRLKGNAELRRLKCLLDVFFSEIDIIIYLRRQDQLASSLYSTALRTGETAAEILEVAHRLQHMFDYAELLSLWSGVFGRQAIRVHIFDRKELIDGDVVTDFFTRIGLKAGHEIDRPPVQNESFIPVAQEFLRRMNVYFPRHEKGILNQLRGNLGHRVADTFPGSGRQLTTIESMSFLRKFEPSNERVRQEWFPERPNLFRSSEITGTPELETDDRKENWTYDDAIIVANGLYSACRKEELRLRADIKILRSENCVLRAQINLAYQIAQEAVEEAPYYAAAHHHLAKILLLLDDPAEAVHSMQEALKLNSRRPDYYLRLATACFRIKDYATLRQYLGDMPASLCGDPRIRFCEAILLYGNGEHEKSARILIECIAENNRSVQYLGAFKTVMRKIKDKKMRVVLLESAQKLGAKADWISTDLLRLRSEAGVNR